MSPRHEWQEAPRASSEEQRPDDERDDHHPDRDRDPLVETVGGVLFAVGVESHDARLRGVAVWRASSRGRQD